MSMSPKEEAEQLIKEFDFRGTPINDALICANEILYEFKHKLPNEDEKKYREEVIEELKKMDRGNS